MVEGNAPVQLAQRRDDQGRGRVAQDVDGDDEGAEEAVRGAEFGEDFRDAGGEHGGCEGSGGGFGLVGEVFWKGGERRT